MIVFPVIVGTLGTNRQVKVPTGATGILAFVTVGRQNDSVTGQTHLEVGAIISADLQMTFGVAIADGDRHLLAIANSQFPRIPVSAGEMLMVAFEATASAVIYFDSADI